MVVVEPHLSSEIDSGEGSKSNHYQAEIKQLKKEKIMIPIFLMIFHDCIFNNCTFPNDSIPGKELKHKEEKGNSDSDNANDSLFSEELALFEKCDFDL